mmetsp:Transcript_21810/g.40617  ORF Transcript_21810/g.40617 Transcript_21810/m.40617 type:complete len:94 (-) Transcript_21810:2713-2994(-)
MMAAELSDSAQHMRQNPAAAGASFRTAHSSESKWRQNFTLRTARFHAEFLYALLAAHRCQAPPVFECILLDRRASNNVLGLRARPAPENNPSK